MSGSAKAPIAPRHDPWNLRGRHHLGRVGGGPFGAQFQTSMFRTLLLPLCAFANRSGWNSSQPAGWGQCPGQIRDGELVRSLADCAGASQERGSHARFLETWAAAGSGGGRFPAQLGVRVRGAACGPPNAIPGPSPCFPFAPRKVQLFLDGNEQSHASARQTHG
jgi:hypothetical protein